MVSNQSVQPRTSDYSYLVSVPQGAIAQLGERLHGMQEVGGSIPPGSTTLRQHSTSRYKHVAPQAHGATSESCRVEAIGSVLKWRYRGTALYL